MIKNITNYFVLPLLLLSHCVAITYPEKTAKESNSQSKISKWNSRKDAMPKNFSTGGHIEVLFNHNQNYTSPPLWGSIGLINLCLIIPCIDKLDSEIDVTYVFRGKELSKEKIKGYSYLITSMIPLLPYSIFYPDENIRIKEKFEKEVYPYIQSKLNEAEKARSEIEKQDALRLKEFNQTINKKCKDIFNFREDNSNILNEEQRENLSNQFNSCIEKKILSVVSAKYPFLKQHFSKEIFFWDTTSTYSLIDLFNARYLSINPETGFKLSDSDFYILKINDKKFTLNFVVNGELILLDFEIRDKKLFCNGIFARNERNPEGWQILVKTLFQGFYTQPQTRDHWDWEFIDGK